MKNRYPIVIRVAALAALLTQSTGAADIAFMSGYAARPGLYPAPVRIAPAPAKTHPSAHGSRGLGLMHLLRIDARLLMDWLEPAPAAPMSLPWPVPSAAVSQAPARAEPAPDRMMVVREPGFVGVAQLSAALDEVFALDYHPPIYQKRFEGPWREGRGVRFRIIYLDVYGVTEGTANGFWVRLSRQPARFAPADVPKQLRESYPIYFHHDLARAEIEVQNTGTSPIGGLEAAARQETLTEGDQAGAAITESVALAFPKTLAPGETASLPYSFRLEGPGSARVNFEQTHLVVTSDEGVLANEAKAGIVDPPNF